MLTKIDQVVMTILMTDAIDSYAIDTQIRLHVLSKRVIITQRKEGEVARFCKAIVA